MQVFYFYSPLLIAKTQEKAYYIIEVIKMDIKELINRRKNQLKLTYLDIAKACDVSEATVSRWASGEIGDMKRSRIAALAKVLQVPPSVLIEDDGFEEDPNILKLERTLEKISDFFQDNGFSLDFDTYDCDKYLLVKDGKIVNAFNLADLLLFYEDAKNHGNFKSLPAAYTIPVLGLVQAGVPITAVENIIDYEELDPKEYKRPEEYFGLKINGDSMEPKLFKDDTVIVHQQSSVENNDIAIVLVNGEDATCKKVTFNDQGIILVSLNPKYEPMFYSLEQIETLPVTIIGKVVELRRKF
ncbi:XRE family transcriptional regulator [Erysipelotrichaceae bacterium OH741_COT-311]|nr:XRE family transcriptional regulator [Erysipelotrichaceae bacterium OH741_COT-311]